MSSSRLCIPICAAIAIASILSIAAHAVVIASGTGVGNTTPPADDFGFENVGETDILLSGVYLGNSWVLTASHVGARAITLMGVTYQPQPGTGVRLTNAVGPPPDLFVYRINGFPALPPIALSSATPSIGEAVSCTGRGWTRQPTVTHWNSSWQELPPNVFTGFKMSQTILPARRWGTNLVTAVGGDVLDTRAIEMVFDASGTTHESQAVVGDSGGGCFAKRGGTWELVGLMFAMGTFTGQPASTAVYGDVTIAGDVAFYRTQIEALTPPPGEVPALPPVGIAVLAALLLLAARRLGYPATSPTRR